MKTTVETRVLGDIKTTGTLLVSDPCYPGARGEKVSDRGMAVVDVEPGVYTARIELQDEGSWGVRVAALEVLLRGIGHITTASIREVFVDSGQMMVADLGEVQSRWGDDDAYDPAGNHYAFNYNGACAATLGDRHDWGGIGDGHGGMIGSGSADGPHAAAVSSTGFGDGSYPAYRLFDSTGACVGVRIEFLDEEE